jgi:hypothetical protein
VVAICDHLAFLIITENESKVGRKSLRIAFYCLIESLGSHAIQLGQVQIQNDLLTSHGDDSLFKRSPASRSQFVTLKARLSHPGMTSRHRKNYQPRLLAVESRGGAQECTAMRAPEGSDARKPPALLVFEFFKLPLARRTHRPFVVPGFYEVQFGAHGFQ